MSSSSVPNDTWPLLIVEHQQRLGICNQAPVYSEADLRTELTQLCIKHKERDAPRLLNRHRKQHSPILDLASAIDSALELKSPDSLTALILGVLKTAIQAALENKIRLKDIIEQTQKLNVIVPSFNRENLRHYHEDKGVRTPLQLLVRHYMDSYCAIFSESAPPLRLLLPQFEKSLDGKKEFFLARQKDWERAFAAAREEEQKYLREGGGTAFGTIPEPMVWQRTKTQFDFEGDLGQGNFGRVCAVKQTLTGKLFAQKFIPAPKDGGARKAIRDQVLNEVAIMEKLQHHHIASMLFYTEVDAGFNLIMLPVAECNLREFLERRCIQANFPRDQIRLLDNWFGCLIHALAFAHANKVKHEDLKPSNILIKDNRAYLADFGCARDYEHSLSSTSPDQRIAGTPVYWPPETESQRGRAADVFALGCVFSEMLTVRQGRSLEDYEAMRKKDERDNPYAFCKNLDAVKDWLQALPRVRDGVREEDVYKLLLEVILIMLKRDQDEREDAMKLKRRFRAEDEVLFCGSCL
ncbi:hypothetical protein LTR56_025291 [Elasticomyces elasticus]|nr:hypothetical protein LTR56_025291 [Elasticomyces elasticus]KAK3618884.1 hypothetical protein LTR22_026208 [Elasticomyces elasticus]KAK4907874.1 hypothetical protein LTR49_023148 [Elasticomyces elasticus]KAK5740878.1 hypothetical protein LTS12_024794 [Elasticomyces elasticus]